MIGIDPISSLFKGIGAINAIRLGKIEQKALLEEVLEEVKDNIVIIRDDYLKNKCSIELVIPALKITQLERAESARKRKRLNFNHIKKGKIDVNCFVSNHQRKYYSEFDTEKILLKIRERVKDIKKVKQLYFKRNKWSENVNPKSRMVNIKNLFVLLSNHLSLK